MYFHIYIFYFFNDTSTPEIYTLSLHDALPIYINIIARRTGKDVNSHTVLDGIITTIMATIQRINIIGSGRVVGTEEDSKIGRAVQQECRDRSRMPSSA